MKIFIQRKWISPDLKFRLKYLAREVSDWDHFMMLVRLGYVRDEIHPKVDYYCSDFKSLENA